MYFFGFSMFFRYFWIFLKIYQNMGQKLGSNTTNKKIGSLFITVFSTIITTKFSCKFNVCHNQGCQFRSIFSGMAETFHTNSKNKTKRNNFHLILNLSPFRIFRLNVSRNVPVSFHMFRFDLEKPLNQIEPSLI